MKILKMHLENFQGLELLDVAPGGNDISVYGDNGVGKSTLYNSFTWLMYGRASTDEKNYTPKTVGTHHLNHVVEMLLELNDKSQITLRKDFHEVYKTKKGNAESVFAGHTTDYAVNGVPVNETEFNEQLKAIYKTEDIAKMLTSYSYFLEDLRVKDRRKILLEMCGDVSFEDVINSNKDLSNLPNILKKPGATDTVYSIDEYIKIAQKEKKLIDQRLKEIPSRIDELEKAKPTSVLSGKTKQELNADLQEQMKALEELHKNKITASVNTVADEIKASLSKLKLEYGDEKVKHMEVVRSQKAEIEKKENALKKQANDLKEKIYANRQEVKHIADHVAEMNFKREHLLAEWTKVSNEVWDESGLCPTCGQLLPPDHIAKAREDFNIRKSKKLSDIQFAGLEVSKEKIEDENLRSGELQAEIDQDEEELNKLNALIQNVRNDFSSILEFEESDRAKEINFKIEQLKERLASVENVDTVDTAKLYNDKIAAVESNIQAINTNISALDFLENQYKRKCELEEEEKELTSKYESIDYGLYLCDLYSKTQAEMLSDKINCHFETLQFRLFIEQQNGGIADDCEALIPCGGNMVPYKSANNAARINAGLEIIDALSKFYGITLPLFVDGCESNCHPRKTTAQQIRLYVSEADKVLRIVNN